MFPVPRGGTDWHRGTNMRPRIPLKISLLHQERERGGVHSLLQGASQKDGDAG